MELEAIITAYRNRKVTVYRLVDPRDGAIRYVGSSYYPDERLRTHVIHPHGTPAKRQWLADLASQGLHPVMERLATVDPKDRRRAERDAILQHLADGHPLTNRVA